MSREFPKREDGPRSGEFVPVVLRGVAANPLLAKDSIGVSFDCEDGTTIRLLLTTQQAECTALSLLQPAYAYHYFGRVARDQSRSESGSPSVDVSTPEE